MFNTARDFNVAGKLRIGLMRFRSDIPVVASRARWKRAYPGSPFFLHAGLLSFLDFQAATSAAPAPFFRFCA